MEYFGNYIANSMTFNASSWLHDVSFEDKNEAIKSVKSAASKNRLYGCVSEWYVYILKNDIPVCVACGFIDNYGKSYRDNPKSYNI